MNDWQNWLALLIVAGAAAYIGRAVLATCGFTRGKAKPGCGSCSACPGEKAVVVPLQVSYSASATGLSSDGTSAASSASALGGTAAAATT